MVLLAKHVCKIFIQTVRTIHSSNNCDKKLSVLFFGTDSFSIPTLTRLHEEYVKNGCISHIGLCYWSQMFLKFKGFISMEKIVKSHEFWQSIWVNPWEMKLWQIFRVFFFIQNIFKVIVRRKMKLPLYQTGLSIEQVQCHLSIFRQA